MSTFVNPDAVKKSPVSTFENKYYRKNLFVSTSRAQCILWMMLTANCHIKKRPTVASKIGQLLHRIFVEIIDFQRGMYYFCCKFYL